MGGDRPPPNTEPAPCGRPSVWTTREVLNAIFYVLRGGIVRRRIQKDLPPRSITFGCFSRRRDEGLFARINHDFVMADREHVGREASPTVAGLDRQSVKTTETDVRRCYDADRKVKGRKRQALIDPEGRTLVLAPQPANVRDWDGGGPGLRLSRRTLPFISKAFADAGYAGEKMATGTTITGQVVRTPSH